MSHPRRGIRIYTGGFPASFFITNHILNNISKNLSTIAVSAYSNHLSILLTIICLSSSAVTALGLPLASFAYHNHRSSCSTVTSGRYISGNNLSNPLDRRSTRFALIFSSVLYSSNGLFAIHR